MFKLIMALVCLGSQTPTNLITTNTKINEGNFDKVKNTNYQTYNNEKIDISKLKFSSIPVIEGWNNVDANNIDDIKNHVFSNLIDKSFDQSNINRMLIYLMDNLTEFDITLSNFIVPQINCHSVAAVIITAKPGNQIYFGTVTFKLNFFNSSHLDISIFQKYINSNLDNVLDVTQTSISYSDFNIFKCLDSALSDKETQLFNTQNIFSQLRSEQKIYRENHIWKKSTFVVDESSDLSVSDSSGIFVGKIHINDVFDRLDGVQGISMGEFKNLSSAIYLTKNNDINQQIIDDSISYIDQIINQGGFYTGGVNDLLTLYRSDLKVNYKFVEQKWNHIEYCINIESDGKSSDLNPFINDSSVLSFRIFVDNAPDTSSNLDLNFSLNLGSWIGKASGWTTLNAKHSDSGIIGNASQVCESGINTDEILTHYNYVKIAFSSYAYDKVSQFTTNYNYNDENFITVPIEEIYNKSETWSIYDASDGHSGASWWDLYDLSFSFEIFNNADIQFTYYSQATIAVDWWQWNEIHYSLYIDDIYLSV